MISINKAFENVEFPNYISINDFLSNFNLKSCPVKAECSEFKNNRENSKNLDLQLANKLSVVTFKNNRENSKNLDKQTS